MCVIFLMQNKT